MIRYRLATRDDHEELDQLMSLSALNLQSEDYTEQQIRGALGTVFGVDTQLIDDGTYFVATVNSRVVGCGGWSKRQTLFGGDANKSQSADPLLNPATDAARIRAFFVDPGWARRGIGMEFINRCESAARADQFQKMELVATLSGVRLYSQAGYSERERFEIELVNGLHMPVVSMDKELT